MARLQAGRQSLRRSVRAAQRRVREAPGWVKAATVGGALVAATRPAVIHAPRSMLLRQYGPHMGAYALAPASAYALARRRGESLARTIKREGKTLAGLAAAGVGTFFGERALLHSVPTFVPERHLGAWGRLHKRRIAWLLTHGVPLGVLAASGIGAGYHLMKRDKGEAARRARTLALVGFGTNLGLLTAEHFLPARPWLKGAIKAAQIGAIPAAAAVLTYRRYRARRKGGR